MTAILNQFEELGSQSQTKDWLAYEIIKQNNNIILTYQFHEWSDTLINDRLTYLNFQKTYKVTSGNWGGEHGYWLTSKVIEGAIECFDISELNENKGDVLYNQIVFCKDTISQSINVKVASKKIGIFNFKCQSIEYADHYNVTLFDTVKDWFFVATHLYEGRSCKFIGELKGEV